MYLLNFIFVFFCPSRVDVTNKHSFAFFVSPALYIIYLVVLIKGLQTVRVYGPMCLGEEVRRGSNLQVGHGDAVQHVVAGLLDGTEQVVEGPDVDAWLLVRSQHGVGLPTTCRQGQRGSREHFSSSSDRAVSVRLQEGEAFFAKTHSSLNLPSVMSQWGS